MQKTKALHSSSLYKKQVRSLTDIIKGFAQNLKKNMFAINLYLFWKFLPRLFKMLCFSATVLHFSTPLF